MTDVVRACRKSWRRLGVPSAVAEEMAAELEAELGEAAADGVTPESFVGGDARSFAAQWAYSRGSRDGSPSTSSQTARSSRRTRSSVTSA